MGSTGGKLYGAFTVENHKSVSALSYCVFLRGIYGNQE